MKLVTEQGRPSTEVAKELDICIDTLRNWFKASAGVSTGQADRQNREARRLRELEAENRALRKQVAEKDEVIDSLKGNDNSINPVIDRYRQIVGKDI